MDIFGRFDQLKRLVGIQKALTSLPSSTMRDALLDEVTSLLNPNEVLDTGTPLSRCVRFIATLSKSRAPDVSPQVRKECLSFLDSLGSKEP